MNEIFYNCNNLLKLDLFSFNVEKVKDLSKMFYNSKKLKKVLINKNYNKEIEKELIYNKNKNNESKEIYSEEIEKEESEIYKENKNHNYL